MTAATVARKKGEPLGETVRECPLCDSTHLEYEFVAEGAPVCGCLECGLLFLNPQPRTDPVVGDTSPADSKVLREIHRANAVERLDQLVAYSNIAKGRL